MAGKVGLHVQSRSYLHSIGRRHLFFLKLPCQSCSLVTHVKQRWTERIRDVKYGETGKWLTFSGCCKKWHHSFILKARRKVWVW